MNKNVCLAVVSSLLFAYAGAQENGLLRGFRTPPDSVKPGCYYYWINDNVSEAGVRKDIAAMARVGIGRAYIGNVGFDGEPAYGKSKLFSEPWWQATSAAIQEGTRQGVDIGLFNSPGWSQSGGPWIASSDAMRYLRGEEIHVQGPTQLAQSIPVGASFQDIAVLAFPEPETESQVLHGANAHISSNIAGFDLSRAIDGDTLTESLLPSTVNDKSVVQIDISSAQPIKARSLVLYPAKHSMSADIELQVLDAGRYKTVKQFRFERSNSALNVGFIPWAPVAISFPEVGGDHFRLVMTHISENGGFAEIRLGDAAVIERYEEKQLAKMFPSPLPLWPEYQWAEQAAVTDARAVISPSAIVNISDRLGVDGVIRWNVPTGKWIIVRYGMAPTGVTNSPATPEGRGYDIDKMNRAALVKHFDAFVGKVQQRIPASDRASLKFVVADSYETGSQNWTDDMAASFKDKYGYDPLPWLPVLGGRVVDGTDRSDRFLWDLRRLVADKVAHDYVGGLREVSNQHGLKLWLENYGHWGYPSEFLQYGGQSDEVAGEFWAEGDLGSIECRDASSAAHIYGKNLVSAESFTSAGNAFGRNPGMLKRRGDWSFTEGINNTIFHVYIQQPTEIKPGINQWFGTEFNRHNTWWEQGKAFIDYIRRCNFMLRQGHPVDDVAYFIGEDAPKMTGIRDPALPRGLQFDYINAEVIEGSMSVRDGRLVLPDGTSYRMLILPRLRTMRPELLQKIEQLVQDGAVVMGPRPERSPSLQGYPDADKSVQSLAAKLWSGIDGKMQTRAKYGKGMILDGVSMVEAMQLTGLEPDFTSHTSDSVLFTHRSGAEGEIYFVSNQENKPIQFSPVFRDGKGQPKFLDPVTAEVRMLPVYAVVDGGVQVPLTLDAGQSCFVVFGNGDSVKKSADVGKRHVNFPQPSILQTLSGGWKVQFDTAMRGPAGIVAFDSLTDWRKNSNDAIRDYSGTAIYRKHFRVGKLPVQQTVYLDLGRVDVMATVTLNGKRLGTVWTPPYRVDLGAALKTGDNQLEIAVVNTWVNRLIGDSKLSEKDRRTSTSVNPYRPDSQFVSSGLLGPVLLETVEYQ